MPTGWFIVQPPATSTAAVALKKAAPALTGGIGYDGSIAPIALSKTRVQMLGYMRPDGPMAVALKKLTVSMVGDQGQLGALAVTLPRLSTDFEQDLFTGALVSTLKPVKLAFALQTQGEIATRLADVDTLLASTQEITGALASRLQYARAVLAGAHSQDGVLATAAPKAAPAVVGTAVDPITPTLHTFLVGGATSFVTPAGSGYKIDRVGVGPGHGGRNYGFGVGSNGGRSGLFAWDTITEGVHFAAGDTITISVAAGNPGGNPATADTTISVNGNVLTAARNPDGSWISGYTGQPVNTGNANSNKDLSYNGQTYVGGSGGTGTSSNNAAGAPIFPGGGGWGSNSNGIAGRPGGNGCAWLYVYP